MLIKKTTAVPTKFKMFWEEFWDNPSNELLFYFDYIHLPFFPVHTLVVSVYPP